MGFGEACRICDKHDKYVNYRMRYMYSTCSINVVYVTYYNIETLLTKQSATRHSAKWLSAKRESERLVSEKYVSAIPRIAIRQNKIGQKCDLTKRNLAKWESAESVCLIDLQNESAMRESAILNFAKRPSPS
jgi:hypothetical protein